MKEERHRRRLIGATKVLAMVAYVNFGSLLSFYPSASKSQVVTERLGNVQAASHYGRLRMMLDISDAQPCGFNSSFPVLIQSGAWHITSVYHLTDDEDRLVNFIASDVLSVYFRQANGRAAYLSITKVWVWVWPLDFWYCYRR